MELYTQEWKTIHVRESQVVNVQNEIAVRNLNVPISKFWSNLYLLHYASEIGGIKLTDNKNENNKFSSLLIRLAIDDMDFRVSRINEVPFDLECPYLTEGQND